MIELLNEVSESPGILGACVYSTELGVMATNLPVRMTPAIQQKIGKLLQQIFELKDSKTLDISTFEIQFDECLILAKKLNGSAALFTLCQAEANLSLVNMSLNMLSNDLLAKIVKMNTSTTAAETTVQSSAQAQTAQKPQSYAEVINGPLAAELKLIKVVLSKSIGPFTGIVLEDGINEWLKSGKSQQRDLENLIQILAREIEKPTQRQSFIDDLTSLFSNPAEQPKPEDLQSRTAEGENVTDNSASPTEQSKPEDSGSRKKTRRDHAFGRSYY